MKPRLLRLLPQVAPPRKLSEELADLRIRLGARPVTLREVIYVLRGRAYTLLIILLIYMGIMSTAFLCKYRRHAIVVIYIIAAIVTPTPDPITQTMFAAPLYVLFELAIIVGRRVEKGRALQASGV